MSFKNYVSMVIRLFLSLGLVYEEKMEKMSALLYMNVCMYIATFVFSYGSTFQL